MRFDILGPLEVVGDNGAIELPHGRARTLLLLMLTRPNQALTIDALVEDLWNGSAPPSAGKIVQGYVGQLRRALGNERIATRGHAYAIRLEDGELDVELVEALRAESRTQADDQRAETLRRAQARFRGRALDDAGDEPFATAERHRLDDLRVAILAERVDAELALGRHADLVPELERAVTDHPLDERLRGQLMLALYRSGRQADALAEYTEIRRLLTDDLGLEPSDDLRGLQRRILEHAPELGSPPANPNGGVAAASPGRRRPRYGWLAAGACLVVGAVAAALVLVSRSGEPLVVAPDSLAVIDARQNRIVAAVPVGGRPTFVAAGAGAVWVANVNDRTVSRVDPDTLRVTATIGLGFEPTDMEADERHVWVVGGYDHVLWRIDADGIARLRVAFEERFPPQRAGYEQGTAGIALSPGHVWLTHGDELSDVDPATGAIRSSVRAGGRWQPAIATDGATVWVGFNDTAGGRAAMSVPGRADSPRYGPNPRADVVSIEGLDVVDGIELSSSPAEMIVASGGVWVALPIPGLVSQIVGGRLLRTVPAGNEPVGLAFADEALWVTNQRDGLVRRLNVRTGQIDSVLDVGHLVEDAAAAGGRVFVAVR
jgi:DNA-binding SARP family transcriptional activator/DNA-binding beta-propeller fold protein YncE